MPSGHIIADLRYKHSLTQTDLANIVGVSKAAVGMWETNRRYPTVENLILLSKYFNVSTDYILGIDDITSPEQDTEQIKSIPQFSGREQNMISAFRELNIDNQDIIIGKTKELLREQRIEDKQTGNKFFKEAK